VKPGPSGPLRPGWRQQPAPSRLAPDHPRYAEILTRHDQALATGLSIYLDPQTGCSVMTSQYLVDRGYCCSVGCRHCPWSEGWDQFR